MGFMETIKEQFEKTFRFRQKKLLSVLMDQISNNDSLLGGMNGLIRKFNAAGLEEIINSWIKEGPNLPITSEQLSFALGNDLLTYIATSTGKTNQETAEQLCTVLPQVVDKLTAGGKIPKPEELKKSYESMRDQFR